jgi:hypothetical protein
VEQNGGSGGGAGSLVSPADLVQVELETLQAHHQVKVIMVVVEELMRMLGD